ncbi:MAG: mechanosensitive ion channel family protein [Candidatus Muirbacterium halophilum]|nr:mechanosensitive ion channel family protein [Candidatus Muirbacterium halophilum]
MSEKLIFNIYFTIPILLIVLQIFRFLIIKNFYIKHILDFFSFVLIITLCHYLKIHFINDNNVFKVFVGVQILVYGMIIYRIQDELLSNYFKKSKNIEANRFIRDLVRIVFSVIFMVIFLKYVFEFNLMGLLTHSAILTAVLGLALQDTIGNIISGIIINVEKPFNIGDWLEIDGRVGQVYEINWRYVKVMTFDNYFVHIPNSKISGNSVVNMSKPVRSVTKYIDIGVSYAIPPLKVKKAINEVLAKNNSVLKNPPPSVRLKHYGDSSIVYLITFTVPEFAVGRNIIDQVYSAIWYQFKKFDIEIPFPIRTVINKDVEKDNSKKNEEYKKAVELIKQVELFDGTSIDNLYLLIEFSHIDTFYKGAVICKEGDIGRTMFFIIEGEVSIFKNSSKIAQLHKGEFFGEFGLLTDEKRNATVRVENSAVLLEIDREGFSVICEKEPIIISQVEKIFDERIKSDKNIGNTEKQEIMKQTLFRKFKKLFGIK